MTYPYYYYPPPFLPYDLTYLMPLMFQWMFIPYYYMIYMEVFKAAVEAWRKAFESMAKITSTST